MDNIPQLGTGQDLEMRAARIADPGVGLYSFKHLSMSFAENNILRSPDKVHCSL
jgi:hypothetical protein